MLVPAEGSPHGPVFILQAVAEERVAKNRMHIDIHPPVDLGVPALVAELESLGATRVGSPMTQFLGTIGIWWQVMTDPEGNEFCVSADPDHGHPHRSRPPLSRSAGPRPPPAANEAVPARQQERSVRKATRRWSVLLR